MTAEPTFADILRVMAAVSSGDAAARVHLPAEPRADHEASRLASALNLLLDDLSFRVTEADRMSARLRILAAAAHDFAAVSHDTELLLDTVVRRVATVVKDQCILRRISEDGRTLIPVAMHARSEDAERRMRSVYGEPLVLAEQPIARRVHETGEPFIDNRLDPESLRTRTTPAIFAYVREIGLHSLLILPLRIQGRALGQLTLMRFRPDSPPFDVHDLELALALANQAALAIANAASYSAERTARVAAEKAREELRESESRYRLMFDGSPLPKWLYDRATLRFLAVNEAFLRTYGYSREEILEMTLKDLRAPEDVPPLLEALRGGGVSNHTVHKHRAKNGETLLIEVTAHTLTIDDRACGLAVGRNVTEQLRLEEQFRQSQKMEAVGRLAGGIAHDFNNLLSVILSYGDMLASELPPGGQMHGDVEEVLKAGRRAADLTRQLLMFSRQHVLEPRVMDLNEVLTNMDKMLQRILGADIALVSLPSPDLGRVRVDPSSMEQVIMNLVVNARDAMPRGGKLTLETGDAMLDEAYARAHLGVTPGPYVMLAVTDTGTGMDKATLARIFEPFFTTKESGKGTGLGLSTVFGIVQQSSGSVWVYSEPGNGTTFKIYLPRVDALPESLGAAEARSTAGGSETILLVEDDDQVRIVARDILRRYGYFVIESHNAEEALLSAEAHAGTINLLVTDVVMPQMSGPELAKRLARSRPDMKVLCMSGYTDDSIVRHGVLEARVAFLQKPLTPQALGAKVREVLDGRAREAVA